MKSCIVFFSGGKDSFITACKMAEYGYNVRLLSFNNGSVICEENLKHGADRLRERYPDNIEYVGVYATAGIFMELKYDIFRQKASEIAQQFPHLRLSQMTCLCCQTSMWIAGIAYCKARDIHAIATGYRSSDVFCTGHASWVEHMRGLAQDNYIEVILPAWDTVNWDESGGFDRDSEMVRRNFLPSVLEPKCTLGLPADPMSDEEKKDMSKFYITILHDKAVQLISEIEKIFRTLQVRDISICN